jgi:hypothetical protein
MHRMHSLGAPLDELPMSAKKEQLSLGFVHIIASAAGFSIKEHKTDYDGVDITIASSADYEKFYCPQFELQVKCTAQRRLLNSGTLTWTLQAGPFNRLTNPKSYLPRFLGVMLVPVDALDWIEQDEEQLVARCCMYWMPAAKLGAITGDQQSKTVRLIRDRRLDVPQMKKIMKAIGDGDEW